MHITGPANGATVSGLVTIATNESANVSWINVYVDGGWIASNPSTALPPYWVIWNSLARSKGRHKISVNGYSSSNRIIAQDNIIVTAVNDAPTATPAPTRTAIPTPTLATSPTATATPSGVVYYVAPSGSDSNNGSVGSPWRTMTMKLYERLQWGYVLLKRSAARPI